MFGKKLNSVHNLVRIVCHLVILRAVTPGTKTVLSGIFTLVVCSKYGHLTNLKWEIW
jgi:hypothetical protein